MGLSIDSLTERDIAKAIDHSLLRPELDDASVADGCRLAARYDVASVCVRPADVRRAKAILAGTDVAVGTTIGFPHGNHVTAVKVAEARQALADGATELDMVIQIGALKSGRDADVEADIKAIVAVAHAAGAIVKVIFENAYLTDDEKVRACRLSEAAGADFVKTSTGFAPSGATHDDLRLMRANTSPRVQVKAAGGVRTLDALLEVMALGVSRIGATATEAIILDFRARKEGLAPAQAATTGIVPPTGTRTRHLGLDLGATNLKWAVVEHEGGTWSTLARDQVATRLVADPDAVPATVTAQLADVAVAAIASVAAHGPVASVGIGVPGLYDPATGETRFLVNVPGPWAGHPVAGPVSAATGLPTALINDARAFGLAELRLGAGRGAMTMVGLTLGTGVGGVVAIDGRVLQGHDGTAGEVGHQTIDPDGPWCGCGNRGCMEAFARADQIAAACGTATAEEAVRAARAGDAQAIRGLADVGRYLGIGLGNMVNVLSPDRIVLGGGVAAAGELLFAPIRAEILRRVHLTSTELVTIVPAELGTWAGAIGAAVHGAERAGAV